MSPPGTSPRSSEGSGWKPIGQRRDQGRRYDSHENQRAKDNGCAFNHGSHLFEPLRGYASEYRASASYRYSITSCREVAVTVNLTQELTHRQTFARGVIRPIPNALPCDVPSAPWAGALAPVRMDDLAATPLRALHDRNLTVDWQQLDDVIYGRANQAGEDNRNVGRMALLLAGLPAACQGER